MFDIPVDPADDMYEPVTQRNRPYAPPLRSILIVPGTEPVHVGDSLSWAAGTGADAVAIDLEEPARPSPFLEADRESARAQVREFLQESEGVAGGPQWWVRIQSIDTHETLKDLLAVVSPALSGVILPKSVRGTDLVRTDGLLSGVERLRGMPVGHTRIMPLLETPGGVRNAYDIAMATGRVAYMGGMTGISGDQARSIGYTWSQAGSESLFIRSKVIIDARAAGVRYPIGGMWCGDKDDLDGMRAFAWETRQLGYFGMLLARRSHVAIANEVFVPTQAEIRYWEEIDAIGTQAERDGVTAMWWTDPESGQRVEIIEKTVSMARLKLTWARGLGLAQLPN